MAVIDRNFMALFFARIPGFGIDLPYPEVLVCFGAQYTRTLAGSWTLPEIQRVCEDRMREMDRFGLPSHAYCLTWRRHGEVEHFPTTIQIEPVADVPVRMGSAVFTAIQPSIYADEITRASIRQIAAQGRAFVVPARYME